MSVIDMQRLYELLGKRISEARNALDPPMSQAELAERLRLERTSITNIERGTQRPPLHVIYEISYALGMNLHELLPDPVLVTKGMPKGDEQSVTVGSKTVLVSSKTAEAIEKLKKGA